MEFSERTGTWQWRGDAHRDGSLNHARLVNWHTSKYSFGLILDGLFAQSNFGIVTRMGVWLLPRPPAVQSFHFVFPDDDDLEEIIELARPMCQILCRRCSASQTTSTWPLSLSTATTRTTNRSSLFSLICRLLKAKVFFSGVLQQIGVPSYADDGLVMGPFYEGNDV
jgi:hypothetical protein